MPAKSITARFFFFFFFQPFFAGRAVDIFRPRGRQHGAPFVYATQMVHTTARKTRYAVIARRRGQQKRRPPSA